MTKDEILNRIKELENKLKNIKGTKCEVWSRVVGFFRPTIDYNEGKLAEFKERVTYNIEEEKK